MLFNNKSVEDYFLLFANRMTLYLQDRMLHQKQEQKQTFRLQKRKKCEY